MSEENRKYLKEEDYVELNSLDAAHRFADEQKRTYKEENKREMKNAKAISMMMPQDRDKYLRYGLRLLKEQRKYFKEVMFMELALSGCSNEMISAHIKRPIHEVRELEKVSLNRVKDAISMAKSTRIPIVGS